MRALDETYVSMGTSSDNVASIINQVIRGHQICYFEKMLPFEGMMRNKTLHVTIACRDKVINFALDDNVPVSIFSSYRL